MFQKLLVPLDGTPESAAALPLARTLSHAVSAEMVLVRVAAPEVSAARDAASYLEAIQAELAGDPAVPTTALVRHGDPTEEIVLVARECAADLIVMSTRTRSGLDRALHTSVAWRTLATSPIPVVLMRPGGRRPAHLRTLLVPVDGSPGGAVALGAAIGLARKTEARIVLAQVVLPIPMYAYSGSASLMDEPYIDPAWDEEARASAQHYVEGLASKLRRVGLIADGYAQLGPVIKTLCDVAKNVDADLVVMSTHALTGPARAVLGSTADALVRAIERPVLLVRQAAPVGEALQPTEAPAL